MKNATESCGCPNVLLELAVIGARAREERVRRDPFSADADKSSAKEARKAAEMSAMLNDADLQRRIAEIVEQEGRGC